MRTDSPHPHLQVVAMTMPFGPRQRKAHLHLAGQSQQEIARATGTDETLVSHVMAGRRYRHPDAPKVMAHVAALFGMPVEVVFPQAPKYEGPDRRSGAA